MSTILVFDIETIPDINALRKNIGENSDYLSDKDVVDASLALHKAQTGRSFLPHNLHQVVCISVVVATLDWVKVWSLGGVESNESEIIKSFFSGIKKYSPTLVSWNGSGFDMPVLHYRMLKHKIIASDYWDTGEINPNNKWNNYINRYHNKHIDLMDTLASFQTKAYAKLDSISAWLGAAGKMGVSGADVASMYMDGNIEEIRNYCETDVLNTYIVYLHYQLIRGHLTQESFSDNISLLKNTLLRSEKQHLHQFVSESEIFI